MNKSLFALLLLIGLMQIHAQPDLEIEPNKIEFEDVFNRFEKVYFINEGNQTLIIDSITYKLQRYFIRWDSYSVYPILIGAGDTLGMDCILSAYNNITASDTTDTMFVYVNYTSEPFKVKIKIDFLEENPASGTVAGTVTFGGQPVQNTGIYFFYEGMYLFESVMTDIYGNFQKTMPVGDYVVATMSSGGNLFYFGNTPNPFSAQTVSVKKDSVHLADIVLDSVLQTGFSVGGTIIDSVSVYPVNKGVVVIRKGKHNPGKRQGKDAAQDVYAALVGGRGEYIVNNIQSPGYYFVQSFSDYFVPSYYRDSAGSSLLWQTADSIYVNGAIQNVAMYMQRDSAYGNGRIIGNIQSFFNDLGSDAVVLYARSAGNGKIYSSGISLFNNTFLLPKLPFGTFDLIAQSIHLPDYVVGALTIDSLNTIISGITINLTDVDEGETAPLHYALLQNYPNPFNPVTTVRIEVTHTSDVLLKVYTIEGSEVMQIFNGQLSPGMYEYTADFSALSSGTYLVRLQAGNITKIAKLLLLK